MGSRCAAVAGIQRGGELSYSQLPSILLTSPDRYAFQGGIPSPLGIRPTGRPELAKRVLPAANEAPVMPKRLVLSAKWKHRVAPYCPEVLLAVKLFELVSKPD